MDYMGNTGYAVYLYTNNETYNDTIELLNIDSTLIHFSSVPLDNILSGTHFDNPKDLKNTLFILFDYIYEENSAELFSVFKKKLNILPPVLILKTGKQQTDYKELIPAFEINEFYDLVENKQNFANMCLLAISKNIQALRLNDYIFHSFQDIVDSELLKKKEEELTKAKTQAEESVKLKSELLAMISHEIRTPLNGIIGMTDLLAETELSQMQQEYINTVKLSSEILLSLVNNILDFSKIEANKIELEIIKFDLRTAIEDAGDILAPKSLEKGLELTILIKHNTPFVVKGDPNRLRQVLINLVNNAIKFTEKGEVCIQTETVKNENNASYVKFDICDTGIGIPEDKMHKLFKSFSQVDSSTTRKYGGTGLGLVISEELVNMMGGNITVTSEVDKGSIFSFTLPFENIPQPKVNIYDEYDFENINILIIDDNKTNRLVFREYLKYKNCNITEAENGIDGLTKIIEADKAGKIFDVIILDFNMPFMDGRMFIEEYKNNKELSQSPIIYITSVPITGDMRKLSKLGIQGYLTKPVKQKNLLSVISLVLNPEREPEEDLVVTRYIVSEQKRYKVKILIAEDNKINQKITTKMLERLGYRCDIASNGEEAINAVKERDYDIILMDCQMPKVNGFEAAKEIRKMNSNVRIIALTAFSDNKTLKSCKEAGMDDLICKPLSKNILEEKLNF
jgi:two-component system, sensor histidine kinase and response regulator